MKHLNEFNIFADIPEQDYSIPKFYDKLKSVKQEDFEVLYDKTKNILVVQGINKFSDSHEMAHVMMTQNMKGKFLMSMKVLQYEPGNVGSPHLVNVNTEEVPEEMMKLIHETPNIFFQNIFDIPITAVPSTRKSWMHW